MAEYIELTDATFATQVENSKGVTLVDFWAPWCGPCLMLAPIIEEVAAELKSDENVKVAKIIVDDNPKIAEKYQITSIPTLGFFVDGQLVDKTLGVQTKEAILAKVKSVKPAS